MRISDWSSDVCSSDLTYIVTEIDRTSPSTAASAFRRLQQLFRWLEDEGEIDRSPMARMQPPTVPEAPVPVISDSDLSALLLACEGKALPDRRSEEHTSESSH